MTTYLLCDYCGEPIDTEDGDTYVEVNARGRAWDFGATSSSYLFEDLGHYHSRPGPDDDPSCYRRILDAISLSEAVGSTLSRLESIPTETGQEIARLRSKHVKRQTNRGRIARERRDLSNEEAEGHAQSAAECAWEQFRKVKGAWRREPREAREALLLDVLGDEQLAASQIAERVNAWFGWTTGSELVRWPPISTENVRPVVMSLVASGRLDRVAVSDRATSRQPMWFFRKHEAVAR